VAIDLTKPLSWEKPTADGKALLKSLQGNILKGHGRDNVTLLFLRFKSDAGAAARAFLRTVATEHLNSALTELKQAKDFKESGKSGDVHVSIALTAACYPLLGVAEAKTPSDAAFRARMSTRSDLQDPPVAKWEAPLKGALHAVVLIADDLKARVDDVRAQIEAALVASKAGKVVAREDGQAMRNKNGDGIEHFGYVDGRSQPLLLVEDIKKEKANGGIDQWDPSFGIGRALVRDPAVTSASAFGSYLVFRKLEQNVRGFKTAEKKLAAKLGLSGEDEELAGALVVGRFEDGTPVVLQNHDGVHPVPNNFTVDGDPDATRCPFAGHIRKTNPRGDSVKLGATLEAERRHLMPRRGIPFGMRATHPNDPVLDGNPALYPTKGVGLLFMAFNADIEEQFEFTQESWVNSPGFAGNTGIDGVIGNGKNPAGMQKWPKTWGQAASGPTIGFDFSGFVTMKGGEYFFAPSIPFLVAL
jgi:Dyp-type peroxidase family